MPSPVSLDPNSSQGSQRVLFWVGLVMCTMCVSAICVAEAFMPENVHGHKAVITFYRWFGAGLVCWGAVVAWAYGRRRSIGNRAAS